MSQGHNQYGPWEQPGGAPSASEPSDPTYGSQSYGYGGQSYPSDQQLNPYEQPPNPYGPPGAYGQPYGYAQPYGMPMEHPQGTLILVLGILGFVTGLSAPVAWYLGSKVRKEIAASGIHYANEGNIRAGQVMGIVMTIVYGFLIVLYILLIIFIFGMFGMAAM